MVLFVHSLHLEEDNLQIFPLRLDVLRILICSPDTLHRRDVLLRFLDVILYEGSGFYHLPLLLVDEAGGTPVAELTTSLV